MKRLDLIDGMRGYFLVFMLLNHLVFAGGLSSLTLSRPGAGNSGSVDLSVNEGAAAAGKTCLSASETNAVGGNVPWFGPNLGARAAFGLYKAPLIYMRENY